MLIAGKGASRRHWACWASALATVAACSDAPRPAVTVTDSAGVRITVTENAPELFARLDSVPSLSIGGSQVSGPAQFFRIQGIHMDANSRLWVADGQSGEVRIFDAAGTHWKTFGGRGEGPGEFLQIRLLGSMRGDSVGSGDSRTDRISVYGPEGTLARSWRLPTSDAPAPRPFDLFDDGSVLGRLPRVASVGSLEAGQVIRDTVELVRVDDQVGTSTPYGSASGPLWLWTGRTQVPIPFTANPAFDVKGSEVHLASGSVFRVRVFDNGRLVESYGVQREPRNVGAEDVHAYRDFVEEYIPEPMRPEYLSAVGHEAQPATTPAYDKLLVSDDGYVWVQVYESRVSAPHNWDVFDRDRRFVGQVHVPGDFLPMVVTRDQLVGVWRDALGVEYVRAYRILREGGG